MRETIVLFVVILIARIATAVDVAKIIASYDDNKTVYQGKVKEIEKKLGKKKKPRKARPNTRKPWLVQPVSIYVP